VCIACSAGYVTATSGLSTCTACDSGYYCGEGASTCLACPSGFYSSGTANTACSSCDKGKYSGIAASGCTDCSAGTVRISHVLVIEFLKYFYIKQAVLLL